MCTIFLSGLGYLQLTGGTKTAPLIFSNSIALNTTYAGCRICLWNDGTQNNCYGFGMNGSTLVYNSTIGTQHSFQVGGVQKAYINTYGLVVNGDIYKYSSTAPANLCELYR